nr:MAG TPA: CDI inhibitor [Caudoviricetes sp.]
MSPLMQARLLLPLLTIIRNHLAAMEHASFRRTAHGAPYIEARTERGNLIASVDKSGLYALDAAGSRHACDPNASQDVIGNAVRRALNDAREEWS